MTTNLLSRLQGLTSPSRKVDALILAWSENRTVRYEDGNLLAKSKQAPYDECVLGWIDPGKNDRNFTPQSEKQPCFTASLDAITTLVERVLPGWAKGFDGGPKTCIAFVDPHDYDDRMFGARYTACAPTPAIALCIALIRAMEARDARD